MLRLLPCCVCPAVARRCARGALGGATFWRGGPSQYTNRYVFSRPPFTPTHIRGRSTSTYEPQLIKSHVQMFGALTTGGGAPMTGESLGPLKPDSSRGRRARAGSAHRPLVITEASPAVRCPSTWRHANCLDLLQHRVGVLPDDPLELAACRLDQSRDYIVRQHVDNGRLEGLRGVGWALGTG